MAAETAMTMDVLVGGCVSPPRILREHRDMCATDAVDVGLMDYILEKWWAWKDEGETAPLWSAFKPFDHPRLLPHITVSEKHGERYRCKIVGEAVRSHLPVKLAGGYFDAVLPPENLQDVMMRFGWAVETQAPNFVEKTMAWHAGCDLISYRSLQLPFAGADNANPRIVSVLDFRVENIAI